MAETQQNSGHDTQTLRPLEVPLPLSPDLATFEALSDTVELGGQSDQPYFPMPDPADQVWESASETVPQLQIPENQSLMSTLDPESQAGPEHESEETPGFLANSELTPDSEPLTECKPQADIGDQPIPRPEPAGGRRPMPGRFHHLGRHRWMCCSCSYENSGAVIWCARCNHFTGRCQECFSYVE
ncbi:MAG: hypothetical protein Q9227_008749 [Pyrenula ochraceoflavens]